MGLIYWTIFWVLFAISVLLRSRSVPRISFVTFLVLMITSNNQMSQNSWVAFWLSFIFSYTGLSVPAPGTAIATSLIYTILTAVRLFVTSDYHMPALVFWTLAILLAPTYRGNTLGRLLHYVIVIFNIHLRDNSIRLPGLNISYYVILALAINLIVVRNLINYPQYAASVFLWVLVVGVFHHHMWPWNREFGLMWMGAWWLLFQALTYAFAPDMPPLWYVMWAAIVVGLGFKFRPDWSLGRFSLWAATILILRIVLFFFYISFYLNSAKEMLFPFNLFSSTWRRGKPRWFPLSLRQQDAHNSAALCGQCNRFIENSKLVMGSSYFTRLVEWHEFSTREEFGSKFQTLNAKSAAHDTILDFPESSCHLCCLMWYSMSPTRQEECQKGIESYDNIGRSTDTKHLGLPKPQDPNAELRIKVWEERPLSLYTYLQLHWGDIPIGSRLLICRESQETKDKPFATPSPATNSFKTNSPDHFEQAKKWLQMCRDSHKLCQSIGNPRLDFPARMLYVCGGQDWTISKPPETIKLIQTSQIDPSTPYLALSHCWGKTEEMGFKLVATNMDACFESINFDALSNNMKDAIVATISLGFSYIWIDSMCILQRDCSNEEDSKPDAIWRKDWEAEAKKMRSVYSGATCTIASTGSSNSAGGCFHGRSRTSLKPCKIGVSSPEALRPRWIYARKDDIIEFQRSVDLAPLNTRGWVMQERLLSRRILHFGAGMIFWECCSRSASELNPHGYTYKKISEDFSDYYGPDLDSYLSTRADLRRAELQGRGISWATVEMVRRRPPPAMFDADVPRDIQAVWQHKFAFWNNVLKPTGHAWKDDEGSEATDHARAGFRAAFEQLRGGLNTTQTSETTAQVGRDSFSQLWYNVVEPYSRRKLSWPTDKLIALKGVEDEVARATKFTYLQGLWKERLVTDLLWFAIDGPGKRLLSNGIPVAPTWSWASIEGAVSLDLLPENTLRDITDSKALVTIEYASPSSDNPRDMTIVLSGPLLPISAPESDGSMWTISIGEAGQASARFFPDIQLLDISKMTGLACLTFLVLNREKRRLALDSSTEDVQGLVVRLLSPSQREAYTLDTYERVGYFTTSYMPRSRATRWGRKALKDAQMTSLRITGWPGTEDITPRT
ncbi:heterokaryon incompatibility protein-domain-containing protein [Nemania abortiva]|nr:heterokaryon incompatibility protein-domain-containing protein [Nemania abortiva]